MTIPTPPPGPPAQPLSLPAMPSGAPPKPDTGRAIITLYRMLLRSQLTKGKVIGLGGLGLLGIVVAGFIGFGDSADVEETGTAFIAVYGLALLVLLVSLMLASRALGNIIEDRLLVYLWLKPLPRWYMAIAGFLAALTVALPLAVVPTAIAAAFTGVSGLTTAAIVASFFASVAYCGLFTALGVRFSRGLWWGLLYILIWEVLLSGLSANAARLSVRSYSFTIVNRAVETANLSLGDRAAWATIVIPLLIAVVSVAYAGHRLAKRDVE